LLLLRLLLLLVVVVVLRQLHVLGAVDGSHPA
jgi:hypothetical protein